jgi:predicted enzyme related to lactoylglutathione lyase
VADHITHLRLVSIPVADVDRAKAFYVDALVTWFDQMPPGSVTGLVLDTPDARAAVEALRERGVEFTGDVREDPWGTSASFVDPDGNGWVLMQTPEAT